MTKNSNDPVPISIPIVTGKTENSVDAFSINEAKVNIVTAIPIVGEDQGADHATIDDFLKYIESKKDATPDKRFSNINKQDLFDMLRTPELWKRFIMNNYYCVTILKELIPSYYKDPELTVILSFHHISNRKNIIELATQNNPDLFKNNSELNFGQLKLTRVGLTEDKQYTLLEALFYLAINDRTYKDQRDHYEVISLLLPYINNIRDDKKDLISIQQLEDTKKYLDQFPDDVEKMFSRANLLVYYLQRKGIDKRYLQNLQSVIDSYSNIQKSNQNKENFNSFVTDWNNAIDETLKQSTPTNISVENFFSNPWIALSALVLLPVYVGYFIIMDILATANTERLLKSAKFEQNACHSLSPTAPPIPTGGFSQL